MCKALRWTAVLGFIVVYAACAPVKFSASENPDQGVTANCLSSSEGCIHDYIVDVHGAKVDILFVNDNSASMSFEQKALANRFSGFVQLLDSKNIDYRIAITTTDVHSGNDDNEPRTINGMGSLQNGNLISFGGGMSFLTPSVADRVSRFSNTIVRSETLQCEQFIANYIAQNGSSSTSTSAYQQQYKVNCPSGDERGIYAANLTLKNNPASFLRKDAYLAIIFVADEDERSGLYCGGPKNSGCNTNGYPLEDLDQPSTLSNTLKNAEKFNSTEIHAVVVKDQACLDQQNSQTLGSPPVALTTGLVNGSYGSLYLTFPQNGWGDSVSICLDNYTSGLTTIANKISGNKGEILNCDDPNNLQITPIPADPSFSFSRNGRSVVFNKQPAPGSQLHFSYTCRYNM